MATIMDILRPVSSRSNSCRSFCVAMAAAWSQPRGCVRQTVLSVKKGRIGWWWLKYVQRRGGSDVVSHKFWPSHPRFEMRPKTRLSFP